jgi:hypothetical protein
VKCVSGIDGYPFNELGQFGVSYSATEIMLKTLFPCDRGMTRPQVADGEESLHICRVGANILNKQSRTADKGFPSWAFGGGLTISYCKKPVYYRSSDLRLL